MKLSNRFFGLLALLIMGSASLQAQSDPFPDEKILYRKYQGSMTAIILVQQNNTILSDAVVAVYCGDEFRGKARTGNGTGPDPNIAYLTIWGDYTGDYQYLHFKVFTDGNVFTNIPDPALLYTFYGSLGELYSPYIIDITPVSLAHDADNSSVLQEYDNQTCDVVLTGRTLFKDGSWNTLCLPFSLSAAQIAANTDFAGATLMTMDVTGKNGFDTEDGTLYLCFKTATAIEAGVPYIVKWEKAADYDNNPPAYDIVNPVFECVTVCNTANQDVESTTTGLETVQMVGTYSPVSVTAGDKSILFLGDANTLYYSSTERQIRSCRAFFSVPYINGHAGAKACAFALSFDGEEETGIILTSGPSPKGDGSDYWYTIDGCKLSGKPTQRGMYINNGKKILVK